MTHLRVEINRIINIQTLNLPKDNTSQPFYYDRQPGSPFSVPAGFSFVITDIIIQPETTICKPTLSPRFVIGADSNIIGLSTTKTL
jgi:hypothetical protein